MHISRVELENIKSHASRTFDFRPGITAIRGENGAGKTTIIEAIAWAMFDVLDYNKDQFVRRGEKKGSVAVTFQSSLDEREYKVFRDSGTAYNITDIRLSTRIADKKEEVMRFLRLHLGLEPGTDLESLFRQAIGVPQGTFTAVFLSTASNRKIVFDRLLKVDEYRDAAAKLLDTARFLDSRIVDARESIARSEGELTRAKTIADEHAAIASRVDELEAAFTRLNAERDERRLRAAAFDKEAEKVAALHSAHQKAAAERERADLLLDAAAKHLDASQKAFATIELVAKDSEAHLAALAELAELEKKRSERDRLQNSLSIAENTYIKADAERRSIADALQAAAAAKSRIAELEPKAVEQEKLETALARARESAASAKAAVRESARLSDDLVRMRGQFAANAARIKELDERAALAAEIAELEKRHGDLVHSLAALQASLDRDEKFQSEVRNGLCPILSQKCLNLAEGETLESFITSQFADLRGKIADHRSEQSVVASRLELARAGQTAAAEAAILRERNAEITTEGTRLRAELEKLNADASAAASAETQAAELAAAIEALGDPRGRLHLLRPEAEKESELVVKLGESATLLTSLTEERSRLAAELAGFAAIETELKAATERRDATAAAYRSFIANEAEAAMLDKRKSEHENAVAAAHAAATVLSEAADALAAAGSSYDSELHLREKEQLGEIERRHAAAEADLRSSKERLATLTAEIARFDELRHSVASGLRERERLEDVAATTSFIRETLKEAAPRVARNYVHHVSVEANLLFREITGNGEHSLKWNDDYSISVEEDGYERPFVSLSGGEQMSAALAVRLALLKQLTEIRIAFFDEPTTNMDETRRENLAGEIQRITNFDQLFVISHDDTFDDHVDNVIVLDD